MGIRSVGTLSKTIRRKAAAQGPQKVVLASYFYDRMPEAESGPARSRGFWFSNFFKHVQVSYKPLTDCWYIMVYTCSSSILFPSIFCLDVTSCGCFCLMNPGNPVDTPWGAMWAWWAITPRPYARQSLLNKQVGPGLVGPGPGLTWPKKITMSCFRKREIQMLEGWTTWKDCWYMGMAQKHRPKNWLFRTQNHQISGFPVPDFEPWVKPTISPQPTSGEIAHAPWRAPDSIRAEAELRAAGVTCVEWIWMACLPPASVSYSNILVPPRFAELCTAQVHVGVPRLVDGAPVGELGDGRQQNFHKGIWSVGYVCMQSHRVMSVWSGSFQESTDNYILSTILLYNDMVSWFLTVRNSKVVH